MHSYWDDFFAIQGVPAIQRDLLASMQKVIDQHHLDYVPASVELADFDPTSTAIGISPLGLTLPPLRRTYDRYFAEIAKPREDWTPYEMRIIGAMVRLGDRAHALELIDRFLADRRPAAWNEWAEVVGREVRKPRFIGDMPHAWVASDFVRSILEAIAFDRENGTLVVGAGVPAAWLPLHVGPLPTYHGTIDVRMRWDGDGVIVKLKGDVGEVLLVSPFNAGARVRVKVPSSLRWPVPSPRRTGARAPDRP